MTWDVENAIHVNYLGFSTGWGSTGKFRLWTTMGSYANDYGEVFHLGIPDNAVAGSAIASAQIIGE